MKKLFFTSFGFLAICLFIISCKKDNNNNSTSNSFKFDNTEYKLSNGFLENYGKTGTEGYNLDLSLISSELTIHESNGQVDSLSGTGDAIYFEIYTSDPAKLSIKDYTFNASSQADGNFDMAFVGMKFNPISYTGTIHDITAGKLSVKNNGSEYEISFDCTSDNGKTITGYYKGSLKYYNYAKKKSALRLPD
jgi:hypothetical protein